MASELAHTRFNGLVDRGELLVPLLCGFLGRIRLLLEQAAGGDPNLVARGDSLACLVEDRLRFVGRLETCERKPEFDRLRNDLDCTG